MTDRGKTESSLIGERFLTLREMPKVLRLSTRTMPSLAEIATAVEGRS
jgi:hypothetical protein